MKRSCSFLFFQTLQQKRTDPPKKRRMECVGGCLIRYERGAIEVIDLGKEGGVNNAVEIRDTKPCNVFEYEENKKEEREMEIDQSPVSHPTNCKTDPQCSNGINSHQSCDKYKRPQFGRRHPCFRRRRWERKKKQRTIFFDSAVFCN